MSSCVNILQLHKPAPMPALHLQLVELHRSFSCIVCVKVDIGRCKIFDMCKVEDVHVCMEEYYDFHFSDLDMLGRPSGGLHGLRSVHPHPEGKLNWLRESFDSQYIPESWPDFDAATFLANPDSLHIWPDAMKGDELILHHEFSAFYISHESFS